MATESYDKTSIGMDAMTALRTAHKLSEIYETMYGKPLDDVTYKLWASLFIEFNKHSGHKRLVGADFIELAKHYTPEADSEQNGRSESEG